MTNIFCRGFLVEIAWRRGKGLCIASPNQFYKGQSRVIVAWSWLKIELCGYIGIAVRVGLLSLILLGALFSLRL